MPRRPQILAAEVVEFEAAATPAVWKVSNRRRPMRGLKGKKVLVTGGASGIGQATATRFLEEGCAVCVLDRSADTR